MAYIDKVTHMRRCAVIYKGNGNIVLEGVNIEGTLVLKPVSGQRPGSIVKYLEEYFDDYLKKNFSDINGVYVELVYKSGDTDESWCPREQIKMEADNVS